MRKCFQDFLVLLLGGATLVSIACSAQPTATSVPPTTTTVPTPTELATPTLAPTPAATPTEAPTLTQSPVIPSPEVTIAPPSPLTPTASPTTPAATATPAVGATVASDIVNFSLETLTVPVGAEVTWTNRGNAPHTSTSGVPNSPDGMWNSSALSQGDEFSFTFEQAGEFPYFCQIHPFMTATVMVVQP